MFIAQRARPLPADFFWDFLPGSVPTGATFTRASSGWYFNSAGVLVSAATNVARFDYDPVTLAPLGYLAEMQSTNSITQSADLSSWSTQAAAAATDGTLGPDGSTQMYKITAAAGAGTHGLRQTAVAVSTNDTYSISFVIKQGTERYCTIGDDGASSWHVATFDFQTGTFTNETNATGQARQLAGGLWRIGAKIVSSNNHTTRACIGFGPSANVGTTQNYTAAGTETGYATAAQLEAGGVGVTSYIPTAGSTVTRSADVLTLPLSSVPGWDAAQGGIIAGTYRLHTVVPTAPGYTQLMLLLSDGSNNNVVSNFAGYAGVGTNPGGFVRSGGGVEADLRSGSISALFTRTRQAIGWGVPRSVQTKNGSLVVGDDTTALLPVAMTTMNIGHDGGGGQQINGTLENVAYYKGARSDSFIQAVSR